MVLRLCGDLCFW
ncbi:hypothetical protein Pint_18380 [Pistacia integerrima]|nr:hypothetical protein Pint_18380 [Pistacia integerrima]